MNARNEKVDWRRDPARHFDGSLPHAGDRRRKPRRRHGLQAWYAPRRFGHGTWLESWPFLTCFLLLAFAVLMARSQGWLP